MPSILALDLATRSGWAFAPAELVAAWPDGPLGWCGAGAPPEPLSGSHRIAPPNTDHGPFYLRFEEWLDGMLSVHRPGLVVFEAPSPRIVAGAEAARRLIGLASVCDLVLARRRIATFESHVQTVRKHFCGTGRARKPEVARASRARGWRPCDDNAADALALLDYAACVLKRRRVGQAA